MGSRILWTLADKPNSVVDDHLSGPVITDKLERHYLDIPQGYFHFPKLADEQGKLVAALHSRKDFAVSPPATTLQMLAGTRLCSHLAPCGGQALPATRLPTTTSQMLGGSARTFLLPPP